MDTFANMDFYTTNFFLSFFWLLTTNFKWKSFSAIHSIQNQNEIRTKYKLFQN